MGRKLNNYKNRKKLKKSFKKKEQYNRNDYIAQHDLITKVICPLN